MAREQSEAVRQKLEAEGRATPPGSSKRSPRHLARRALAVMFTKPAREAKSFPALMDVVAGAMGDDFEHLTELSVSDLLDALTLADLVEAGTKIAGQK